MNLRNDLLIILTLCFMTSHLRIGESMSIQQAKFLFIIPLQSAGKIALEKELLEAAAIGLLIMWVDAIIFLVVRLLWNGKKTKEHQSFISKEE